jgi:hypothetical protein
MAFVWYPAEKPWTVTEPAAYLPGTWVQERQREFEPWSLLAQRLGSVRTHSYENVPIYESKDSYPGLIMEAGLGPLPTDYRILAENLATHGNVVVASAPTYSASVVVFVGGRVTGTLPSSSFPGDEDAPVRSGRWAGGSGQADPGWSPTWSAPPSRPEDRNRLQQTFVNGFAAGGEPRRMVRA